MERPSTPEQREIIPEYDTGHRSADIWHVKHNPEKKKFNQLAAEHGIDKATRHRWGKERELYGTPVAMRKVRKFKAKEKDHKLGRSFRVPLEKINSLLSDAINIVREEPYDVQARMNDIPLAPRSLQYNVAS